MVMKVSSRAELHAVTGDKPKQVEVNPIIELQSAMKQMASAIESTNTTSAKIQTGMLALSKDMATRCDAMEAAMNKPKPKTLVADVERDGNNRMKRVVITLK